MLELLNRIFKEKGQSAERADWLFIGLGNPGEKYSRTRHNIGWMVIDKLIAKNNSEYKKLKKLCLASEISIHGKAITAAKPLTYMNLSGEAVKFLMARYKTHYNNVIIISDEYNFPTGRLHLRRGGSDGGHNGVSSVIEHTGKSDFLRLRCGIGKNFPPGGMVEYVLSEFANEEISAKEQMIVNAVTALEYIVSNGADRAMSEINSGRIFTNLSD